MGLTNFPGGVSSFGVPIYAGGMGMGVGKVFHLVTAKSSTDLYYNNLYKNKVPPGSIFSALAEAYAAMTSEQNDVLLVYPGDHIQTASLTWAKSGTRIIGVGAPNTAYQPTTLPAGQVRFKTVTANVGQIFAITAHSVSMYGIGTYNNYDDADNLYDIKISGRNFYAENCFFRGGNGGSTQLGTDGAGVPICIDSATTGGGNAATFVNCVIGSSGNTARTQGPACMLYLAGANAGFGNYFQGCRFSSRVETATANNVCQIRLAGAGAADRELYFNDCLFYNFVQNWGATYIANAVDDECTTTHSILLKNCIYHGMDAISNTAHAYTNMPAGDQNGGEATVKATS